MDVSLGKGADHQQPLTFHFPDVAINAGVELQQLPVSTFLYHRQTFPQVNSLFIEIQNGIRVSFLLGYVDLGIVLVYIKPRRSGGETGIFCVRPLHRCPGGIPGGTPHPLQTLFRGFVGGGMLVLPSGLDVFIHLRILWLPVQHADFLTLIDKGRTLLEQIGGSQHFSAFFPECLTAVPGQDPGMVVIFQIQHVPCFSVQLGLPAGKSLLQPIEDEGGRNIVGEQTVGTLALKLDHHIHLAGILVNIAEGHFRRDQGSLRQGHAVVVIQYILLELRQVFVDPGPVVIVEHAFVNGEQVVIRQAVLLGNVGDHVFPEAIHTHIQPETKDIFHFFPDFGVVHIQIRLLHGEQMEIVFLPHLIPGPGLTLEITVPVIGQFPVGLGGTPDVVVGVRFDSPAAFLEPFVLVTGVIYHQIHDDLHTPLMGAIQNLLEGFHAAVHGIDVHVVGNIITAVRTGGGVQGRKPDAVDAQGFQIVQLFQNAPQVTHAIAVPVLEAPGPDLIKNLVLIPACPFHIQTSLRVFGRVFPKK